MIILEDRIRKIEVTSMDDELFIMDWFNEGDESINLNSMITLDKESALKLKQVIHESFPD
jgi:hypothetical protein